MSAETVVVAGGGYCGAEEVLILVDRLDDGGEEELEGEVILGVLARREKVLAGICGERPVVVLAGAVDAREGLFVQQADQTVLFGDLLHDLHGQLVVIVGDI